MIIDEAFEEIQNHLKQPIQDIKIKEVRMGLHLTALKLSNGAIGLAGTYKDSYGYLDKSARDFGDFTPLQMEGKSIKELFESSKKTALIRTLKIAALNALVSNQWNEDSYNLLHHTDPIDLITFQPHHQVTLVGAFHSYIATISEKVKQFHVLELNKEALHNDHLKYYVPANDYLKIIPQSDIVIITGLTLVNETLDMLLSVANPKSLIVVTGPSSGIPPGVLFKHHVKMIGVTKILQPEKLMQIVMQGATGFHLFKYCAEKICIVPR